MFAKILPYFLQQLSEQHAAVFPTDGQDGNRWQYRLTAVPLVLSGPLCPAGISPPRGESPLSGEAIMKIDFRESALFPVEIVKNFSTFCFSLRIL